MIKLFTCLSFVIHVMTLLFRSSVTMCVMIKLKSSHDFQCMNISHKSKWAQGDVQGVTFSSLPQVREVLKHIKEHPFPAVTIFPDNRPHYFRRDNLGSWTPAELPNNNDSTPDANVQAAVQAVAATGAWTQAGGVTTTSAPPTPAALSTAPWGASVPHRWVMAVCHMCDNCSSKLDSLLFYCWINNFIIIIIHLWIFFYINLS